MKKIILILTVFLCFLITGCGNNEETDKEIKKEEVIIETISTTDVKEIVDNFDEHLDTDIIDVRTEEEFEEGHIKGAINIPLAHISEINLSTEQTIIVYCQSGSRSRQAAKELKALGYDSVKDMGGINDWEYELEES